jgi:hypothetical protein
MPLFQQQFRCLTNVGNTTNEKTLAVQYLAGGNPNKIYSADFDLDSWVLNRNSIPFF